MHSDLGQQIHGPIILPSWHVLPMTPNGLKPAYDIIEIFNTSRLQMATSSFQNYSVPGFRDTTSIQFLRPYRPLCSAGAKTLILIRIGFTFSHIMDIINTFSF